MTERTTTPRRRISDLSAARAAELGGRIDVIEEKIGGVDRKVDDVAARLGAQVAALSEKMDAIKEGLAAGQAERTAFITAVKMMAEARNAPADLENDANLLQRWKTKAWDILAVALAVIGILGAASFLQLHMLSPQAVKDAREVAGAVAH